MMKKILMLFALATFFAACSPVEYDTFSTITGTVVDKDNGEPVGNVMITMTPGNNFNTYTGSDGFFQFDNVEVLSEKYTLTTQKTGYTIDRKSILAIGGETVNVYLTIEKLQ